jgi:hypothetical protein
LLLNRQIPLSDRGWSEVLVKDPDTITGIAGLIDYTSARHARSGSETSTLKRSDATGRLLLKKTERQILGEFFVAAAAFREGRDAKPSAKYRLAPNRRSRGSCCRAPYC